MSEDIKNINMEGNKENKDQNPYTNYTKPASKPIESVTANNLVVGQVNVSASVTSFPPSEIVSDGFEFSNSDIIPSEIISGSYAPQDPDSTIELFVYDLNKNVIINNYDYTGWDITENTEDPIVPTTFTNDQGLTQREESTGSLPTNLIQINPAGDAYELGIDSGEVYVLYNFLTNELGSSNNNPFYISEISSDRTEVRLKSNTIENVFIRDGYKRLVSKLNSSQYFDEFYINFYNNIYSVGINCLLDDNPEEGPSVLVKTFSPIPVNSKVGDRVYVVTKQSETLAWEVDFYDDFSDLIDNATYIKGPNINISLQDLVNNSTGLKSREELLKTNSSQSLDATLNVLNQKGVTITPNYSYNTFNEFVNFSSAKERINNFYEKVSQIQAYQADIDVITTTTGSNPNVSAISQSLASLQTNISNLVENFDGYENYLYYNNSQFAYPKTGSSYPYTLLPTGSTTVLEWLGSDNENSQYYGGYRLSASLYDEDNQNWLYYTIPSFITENDNNNDYVSFSNMVGQSFDEIWLYTKALSERYNTTNNPDTGLPLGLAAEAIKGLGFETFGNNYDNQDNFIGLTGEDNGIYVPPTGSELITKYVAINGGQIVNYWDLGYSWLHYVQQVTEPGFPYAIDKVSKEIYKRLYHNMAYLTKKKGTISGLRQLINIWGIPNTILRINEFGGKNRDNTDDYDLWYKRYSYAYTPVANAYAASSSVKVPWMPLERNYIADSNQYIVPDGVALRFKTTGHPSSSYGGSYYSQSIAVKKSNGTADNKFDWGIGLFYEDQPSGSYSGSSFSDYYDYGKLRFYLSGSAADGGVAISDDIELPFFDGGWWTVLLQRDQHVSASNNGQGTTYTLYAGNKLDNGWDGNSIGWTGSVSMSTQAVTSFIGYDSGFYEEAIYDNTLAASSSVNASWNSFGTTEHDGVYVGGYVSGSNVGVEVLNEGAKIFSGSLQEFRYYSNNIAQTVFNDFVMNPESIEGNNVTGSESSFDIVNFRAPLGNELEHFFTASDSGSYIENISSSHPAITGSAPQVITSSFINPSNSSVTSSYEFIHYSASTTRTYSKTNVETYFLDQPSIGIRNRVSNKIQVEDGEKYGNVLSQFRSIQQNYLISESYTEDISSLEVGFSPQDEVNDDIIASFGYGVISDTLADPRFAFSGSQTYYPQLRKTAEDYFKKYTEGNVWDYLRLIKYFDNSIFKAIKSYVPARTSVTTGIIVKQHMLERNRRVPVTIDPNTVIAFTPETGSVVGGQSTITGNNSPISFRNLMITGSIDFLSITASAGGSVNPYNVLATQHAGMRFYSQTSPGSIPDQYVNLFEQGGILTPNENISRYTEGGTLKGIRLAYPLRTAFTLANTQAINFLDPDTGIKMAISSSKRGIIGEEIFMSASLTPINTKITTNEYKFTTEEDITFWVKGINLAGDPQPTQVSYLQFDLSTDYFNQTNFSSSYHNTYTSQSYIVKNETISGSVYELQDSQDEFYNGEFSGSEFVATTQSLLNNPYAPSQTLNTSYVIDVSSSVGQWDYVQQTPISTYPSFSLYTSIYVLPFSAGNDDVDDRISSFEAYVDSLTFQEKFSKAAIILEESAGRGELYTKAIILPPLAYPINDTSFLNVTIPRSLLGFDGSNQYIGGINNIPLPPVSASNLPALTSGLGFTFNNLGPYWKLDISGSLNSTPSGGAVVSASVLEVVDFAPDPRFGNLSGSIVLSNLFGKSEDIQRSEISTNQMNWVIYKNYVGQKEGQRPLRLNGTLGTSISQSYMASATMSVYYSDFDLAYNSTTIGTKFGNGGWLRFQNNSTIGNNIGTASLFIQGTTWTGSYGDFGTYAPYGITFNRYNYDENGNTIDNTSTLLNEPSFQFTLGDKTLGTPATEDYNGLSGSLFKQDLNNVVSLLTPQKQNPNKISIGYAYDPTLSRTLSGSRASGGLPGLWTLRASQDLQYVNFNPQLPPFTEFYNSPYNSLINNVSGSVPNTYLQQVEYEGGSSTGSSGVPSNIIPIISGSALKATIPDSFYTQKASIIPRYIGSKLQSADYNLKSLGLLPGSDVKFLNGGLTGSTITSSAWLGDSRPGTMRSVNTPVSTIFKAPIYFAHFKTSYYNQNNDGTYTFEIDSLIESPLNDIQGNAPELPKIIKVDGTDTWITDVRSTFEVDRQVSVAYTTAKYGGIDYGNLRFGSNKIFQGASEFQTIGASSTGQNGLTAVYRTPRSTPTMSFYPPEWGDFEGDPIVRTNNFLTNNSFGNYLLTGSDASGGFLVLGGEVTYFSQSLQAATAGSAGSTVIFQGAGLGLINSINTCVSQSKAAGYKKLPFVSINIGVPINSNPGTKPPNPEEPGNYIIQNYVSSSLNGGPLGLYGFPESQGSGSIPFQIKKGDELVCTFNTSPTASQYADGNFQTRTYTVTEVSSSIGIGAAASELLAATRYSASICDNTCALPISISPSYQGQGLFNVLKVYPDPSNDNIVKGEINNFIVRRRSDAGDRVIIYQTPPQRSVTSVTGSGEGYLIPGDFTPIQKRNVQSLIARLTSTNVFQGDNPNQRET